jgi:ubiquinone/menaquinone biosynthesis C-methylase UbiE
VERPQRLVFGTVAEAYDAHRPGYPDDLFDSLVELVGPDARALDAGAGTGKVAEALADRGLTGTAVEPDADMAAVAARRLEGTGWSVVVGELETCEVHDGAFDLFTCGQAWHWIDTERGLERIRRVLRPGGVAAIFWNRPDFSETPALRADLDAVYRRIAPEMVSSLASSATGCKGEPPPVGPAPEGFTDAEVRTHQQVVRYTSTGWVDLLATHSNHVMLEPDHRAELHGAVGDVIDAHGGAFDLVYRCDAWVARRA